MTEGLADDQLHATHRHETLYGRWKIAPVSCSRWCGRRLLLWGRRFRLADDQEADPDLGILKAVGAFVKD